MSKLLFALFVLATVFIVSTVQGETPVKPVGDADTSYVIVFLIICCSSWSSTNPQCSIKTPFTVYGGSSQYQNFYEPAAPSESDQQEQAQSGVVEIAAAASSATTTGYNGAAKGQQNPPSDAWTTRFLTKALRLKWLSSFLSSVDSSFVILISSVCFFFLSWQGFVWRLTGYLIFTVKDVEKEEGEHSARESEYQGRQSGLYSRGVLKYSSFLVSCFTESQAFFAFFFSCWPGLIGQS